MPESASVSPGIFPFHYRGPPGYPLGVDASNALIPIADLPPPIVHPGSGRPTDYTPELGNRVLHAITGGMLLREVARQPWAPSHATIYRWELAYPAFRDALASARKASARLLAESCKGLTDHVDADAPQGVGSARVAKVREQVGVRRWLAGVLDRDTYGDRTDVRVSGELGLLQAFVDLTPRVPLPVDDVGELPHVSPPDVPPST